MLSMMLMDFNFAAVARLPLPSLSFIIHAFELLICAACAPHRSLAKPDSGRVAKLQKLTNGQSRGAADFARICARRLGTWICFFVAVAARPSLCTEGGRGGKEGNFSYLPASCSPDGAPPTCESKKNKRERSFSLSQPSRFARYPTGRRVEAE